MTPKYIDAERFLEDNKEFADREFIHPRIQTTLRDLVDEAPTEDVEPIVHAHWRYMGMTHDGLYIYACLKCGRRIFIASSSSLKHYPYCHCGARMDEEIDK